MKCYEKFQSLFILGTVILGLLLGKVDTIHTNVEKLIVPFLMIMLYGIFLQIPLERLKESFKNFGFTTTSLTINFIITPIFAGILGYLFLRDTPELWIGFVMLMVTPCTDWYLVFTSMAHGNVALSMAILPLNLILQLVLLPVYLLLFTGQQGSIDAYTLFESVVLVLAVPLLVGYISKRWMIKYKGEEWMESRVFSKLGIVQFLFLNLAIMAMFASQGKLIIENPQILVKMLLPIVVFFVVIFIIGQVIGRIRNFGYSDTVSLNLTTMARNSPISLAIAMTAFPDKPLVALALVVGPLIELPILAGTTQVLLWIRKMKEGKQSPRNKSL